MSDISNIQSYDYQETLPDIVPGSDTFEISRKNQFPLLRYMVDIDNAHNQPGCHSTCSELINDFVEPDNVYSYNACMISCGQSGTSGGIISSKVPRK